MPERIVVCFRGAVPADDERGAAYLARALGLKTRAEAHGAALCGWSAWTCSFAFEPDELEEAVRLATLVFEVEGFGAGIAEGEMIPVGERGSVAGLAWGRPLVNSAALARAAGAGEVLIDEALWSRRGEEITALGFPVDGDRIKRLSRAGHEGLDAGARVSEVSLTPPGGTLTSSSIQMAAVAYPSEPERQPGSLRDPRVEMAKKALLQGDTAALERLIAELREAGSHADLVERMSGFIALRRGATADALRRLRAATEAVKEPAQRARARLAYGVALASAGRTESALLEALEGLARAREAGDAQGEHACALFLARLSAVSGHSAAASTWALVAARAEGPA
jgi:hypothetical protein